jgi:predicted ester cyclase
MSTDSVRFVKTWFEEVWNKGRLSAIDEMLADGAVMHGLGEAGADASGPAGFKPFVERLRGAFSDIDINADETIEQGDLIASRWVATMRHTGDDLGVAATGRNVTVTGMSIARLQDGKMVEGWNNWDMLSLMQQIEAFRTPATLIPT